MQIEPAFESVREISMYVSPRPIVHFVFLKLHSSVQIQHDVMKKLNYLTYCQKSGFDQNHVISFV